MAEDRDMCELCWMRPATRYTPSYVCRDTGLEPRWVCGECLWALGGTWLSGTHH